MGSESSSALPAAHRTGWTSAKIIGLIVIIIVLASSGGAGFSYYVLRPASSLPKGQCSNNATNYPSCNMCASGSTFTGGACYNNCTNGTTNPPTCNKYPPCSNGGANPPTCTPPCTNGAANPPSCNEYPTQTGVSCNPSIIEPNISSVDCIVTVYSAIMDPAGTVSLDCRPHNTSGSPECLFVPPSTAVCPLSPSMMILNVTLCNFTVEATGVSLTVIANYPGLRFAGGGGLLNSTGSFSLSIVLPPSSVVVSGTAKSPTLGIIVTGIVFKSATHTYRAAFTAGNYNVTLVNFETYTVTISFTLIGKPGSCNAGTLSLASAAGTLTADYQC